MAFFVSAAHCMLLPAPAHARVITTPETAQGPQPEVFEILTSSSAALAPQSQEAIVAASGMSALSQWPREPLLTLCPVRGFVPSATPSLLTLTQPSAGLAGRAAYRAAFSRPKEEKVASVGTATSKRVAKAAKEKLALKSREI